MLVDLGGVSPADVTAGLVTAQVRAELAIIRGELDAGLAAFERSLHVVEEWGFGPLSTSGLEPWTLVALSTDLAAHARYGHTAEHRARGAELAGRLGTLLEKLPASADVSLDYPITGMCLAALGLWVLGQPEPGPDPEDAVRLIALAHGFGYNRWFPVMAWDFLVSVADETRPGLLPAVLEEYGDRRGRAMRPEAERVLGTVLRWDLTSSV